ncbi:MAG: glycosyltransferase family 2 protein [Candidatus Glassbacteria bacterium]|nr:glycosyltransferase family 2 protein [Candidatus Glassbacteria bacterium]
MVPQKAEKVLAIIPAFNEAAGIAPIVRELSSQGLDVAVIDDCSTDRTSRLAAEAGAAVLEHPYNLGYGAALQTGYLYALQQGYRYVLQLDADGQHDPAEAGKLLEPVLAGSSDLVIGSRFLGHSYRVPFFRRTGIRWFGLIARVITGHKLSDCTSGYQAMNAAVLGFYCGRAFPADYPDADVLIMLPRSGFRIVEVPVSMRPGQKNKSLHSGVPGIIYYIIKMTLSIFLVLLRKRCPNGT